MKYLAILLINIFLSGCASMMTSKLGDVPVLETNSVNIVDLRKESDKEYFRDGPLTPVQILGDSNFEPSLMLFFESKLEAKAVENGKKYNIEITSFRVVDNFARRMGAGQAGALASVGILYVSLDAVAGSDFVLFEFKGSVNGKEVDLKSVYPYHASAISTNILNDDSFKKAIDMTVSDVVGKIAAT